MQFPIPRFREGKLFETRSCGAPLRMRRCYFSDLPRPEETPTGPRFRAARGQAPGPSQRVLIWESRIFRACKITVVVHGIIW
jgi:hypothetical protein